MGVSRDVHMQDLNEQLDVAEREMKEERTKRLELEENLANITDQLEGVRCISHGHIHHSHFHTHTHTLTNSLTHTHTHTHIHTYSCTHI